MTTTKTENGMLTTYHDLEQREEWRAIPGYEGYEVSDLGRVRSYRAHGGNRGGLLTETPRIKKTRRHGTGHADGDRMNAHLSNLRYATPLENAQDKHRHGTTCRGESNGVHKLTDSQVRQVVARYRAGELQRDLARSHLDLQLEGVR